MSKFVIYICLRTCYIDWHLRVYGCKVVRCMFKILVLDIIVLLFYYHSGYWLLIDIVIYCNHTIREINILLLLCIILICSFCESMFLRWFRPRSQVDLTKVYNKLLRYMLRSMVTKQMLNICLHHLTQWRFSTNKMSPIISHISYICGPAHKITISTKLNPKF